ncbi:MAG: hypothetical protein ACFFCW_03675 [Candidatus Hodarchaeota archaeon]
MSKSCTREGALRVLSEDPILTRILKRLSRKPRTLQALGNYLLRYDNIYTDELIRKIVTLEKLGLIERTEKITGYFYQLTDKGRRFVSKK